MGRDHLITGSDIMIGNRLSADQTAVSCNGTTDIPIVAKPSVRTLQSRIVSALALMEVLEPGCYSIMKLQTKVGLEFLEFQKLGRLR